jgi:hypothetical protein
MIHIKILRQSDILIGNSTVLQDQASWRFSHSQLARQISAPSDKSLDDNEWKKPSCPGKMHDYQWCGQEMVPVHESL